MAQSLLSKIGKVPFYGWYKLVSGYFGNCIRTNRHQKMDYKSIAEKIIELKNADLALRDNLVQNGKLSQGYDLEMKQLHNENAKILDGIINSIGYPTIDKVDEEANEATWLIIQHSIEQPNFMKKCAELLETDLFQHNLIPLA